MNGFTTFFFLDLNERRGSFSSECDHKILIWNETPEEKNKMELISSMLVCYGLLYPTFFFFFLNALIRTPVQLNTVFLSYAQVLKSFQVRKFHRTIGTNVLFTKVDFKDRDECFLCDSKHETIEHLFWCCDRILGENKNCSLVLH